MSTTMEQMTLLILFKFLVLSVIDYGLGLLSLSTRQIFRLEKVQNAGMRIVLGCTRDTSVAAMRYTLGLTSIKQRHKQARVKAIASGLDRMISTLYIQS